MSMSRLLNCISSVSRLALSFQRNGNFFAFNKDCVLGSRSLLYVRQDSERGLPSRHYCVTRQVIFLVPTDVYLNK